MIKARQLKKSFGAQRVLDGVDLQVEKESRWSSLAAAAAARVFYSAPDRPAQSGRGRRAHRGESIAGMNERQLLKVRRKFGMLFQGAALFDSLTVAENVGFVLHREGKTDTGGNRC